MKIQTKLKLSSIDSYVNGDGELMYRVKFLDQEDENFLFFFNKEQAQPFLNGKHYQEFDLTLNLYKSNRGRYNLYVSN